MIQSFVTSLVLVDLPFLVAVLAFGWRHPVATVEAFYEWRAAHAWTFVLTVPAALLVTRRWWMR